MHLMLDTADAAAVAGWLPTGIVRGVTTNPILLREMGVHERATGEKLVAELADAIHPLPLSVPVWRLDHVLDDARSIAALRQNTVVKIPVHTPAGVLLLGEIHELAADGIQVNATCLITGAQALAAASAGAAYVSLLGGRMSDQGRDPYNEVRSVAAALAARGAQAQLIVGSVRAAPEILRYWEAGAHVVTCRPELLATALVHPSTAATAEQFYAGWEL